MCVCARRVEWKEVTFSHRGCHLVGSSWRKPKKKGQHNNGFIGVIPYVVQRYDCYNFQLEREQEVNLTVGRLFVGKTFPILSMYVINDTMYCFGFSFHSPISRNLFLEGEKRERERERFLMSSKIKNEMYGVRRAEERANTGCSRGGKVDSNGDPERGL